MTTSKRRKEVRENPQTMYTYFTFREGDDHLRGDSEFNEFFTVSSSTMAKTSAIAEMEDEDCIVGVIYEMKPIHILKRGTIYGEDL